MIRGEIWTINLDPTIGQEIQKSRPGIIVNNDSLGALNLRIIVPITGWKHSFGQKTWFVNIKPDSMNNLSKESAADVFQVRSVSTRRFSSKIGKISSVKLKEIENKLIAVLDLSI